MSDTFFSELESEAIEIIREVAATAAKPVMLYSIGKDSSVMLRLAQKAFYPGPIPFPLLHIDTGWKFREMIAFRERMVREAGFKLLVYTNPRGVAEGIGPITHGSAYHTDVMKTEALKQALDLHGFDVAFGGARRDEEKSRAKERIFSFRAPGHRWDPKVQRPELWNLYNTRINTGETIRVFPLSNWTEADIWGYIRQETIPIVPLYFSAVRPVVKRDDQWIMVDDHRLPLEPGETPQMLKVRFRTLGCYPLTAAIESNAVTIDEIVAETLGATTSERQGRVIDHDGAGSMERKKQEGYFLMDTLRFITCGSVDDGKSTLIGRLLYETKLIFEDQLEALKTESKKFGTQGERLDFALLVDGLQAEREQGITIDVAYRFFSTPKRRFIVADTPGHEQYTRNMATGASTAQAAVLLIDARKGVLVQTKRHSRIVSMLGIRHVALAVNKMDLVGGSQLIFDEIELAYRRFAEELRFETITAIPMSALEGYNIVEAGCTEIAWYQGPSLLQWLETVPSEERETTQPFSMPVQWVNRPNLDFRGFSGRIASGTVKSGDIVRVSPSGVASRIKDIAAWGGSQSEAQAGQSVTLVLEDEIDISRGDVIAAASHPVEAADQFEADLFWMSEQPLLPGRSYAALIHTKAASVTITHIKHRLDINTGAHLAAKTLSLNEIATVNISFDRLVPFAPYTNNKRLGAFIIIDKLTNETVGAGIIHFALRRAANVHWQAIQVTKSARAEIKHQQARCLWFTGLSGSGKSTITNLLEKRLHAEGKHTYILDGDNIRHGLNRDLGFTEADRVENIRRVAEVAKLFVDAGLIVLVSFISPFRAERQLARSLFDAGEFLEIFVDTPIEECERRDVKGLYAKARRGELKNFTGIDSSYEPPEAPEIHLHTVSLTAEACVDQIMEVLGVSPLNSER